MMATRSDRQCSYSAHPQPPLDSLVLRRQALVREKDYRGNYKRVGVRQRLRHLSGYIGSLLLDIISGYGYRPLRAFAAYALVVLTFAAAYFALGIVDTAHALSWNEALVVSMTAFHGRGFFASAFSPGDPQAAVAAFEALLGLLIEITFIATFAQRFFAR